MYFFHFITFSSFSEGIPNHPLDILYHCIKISKNSVQYQRKTELTRLSFCRGIIFFAESIIGGFHREVKSRKAVAFLWQTFDLNSLKKKKIASF